MIISYLETHFNVRLKISQHEKWDTCLANVLSVAMLDSCRWLKVKFSWQALKFQLHWQPGRLNFGPWNAWKKEKLANFAISVIYKPWLHCYLVTLATSLVKNAVILLLANFFVVNTVNMRGEYFYPVTVPQYYQVKEINYCNSLPLLLNISSLK